MAHEIYIDEGRASIMYAGEIPWHQLGQRVEGAATAAEAIEAANLDWRVTKLPLYGTNGILGVPVHGKYAVVREDKIGEQDAAAFGIVGEGYTPLQNREAFAFFDTIVRDKKAAIYHTAGALGRGERIWVLAKLPSNIVVARNDVTNKFLLLSNSHDGTAAVQIKFTPIRVVCNNTLTMALNMGESLSFPHFRDLQERLKNAERMLGIINLQFGKIEETFKEMADVRMNVNRLSVYLNEIFPDPLDQSLEQKQKKARKDRAFAEKLFAEGEGNDQPGVKGTLWAAYNGITELVDHRVKSIRIAANSSGSSQRLKSIWFGEGARTKERAYRVAVEKLDEWRN